MVSVKRFIRISLFFLSGWLFLLPSAYAQNYALTPVNFAITAVAFKADVQMLQAWRHYLESALNRPVHFLQRDSYEGIMHLLKSKKADFAWICGYPYVKEKNSLILVATPQYRGKPFYQSVLIVNKNRKKPAESIFDLENEVLAYSDPLSNSGYLYPSYLLAQWGVEPDKFFKLMVRTYAHENSIRAVATGLADAAFVDSYVLDVMRHKEVNTVSKITEVMRSPDFGFPPIVANASVSSQLLNQFQAALLKMNKTESGKQVLEKLFLDSFTSSVSILYNPIEEMSRFVEGNVYQ